MIRIPGGSLHISIIWYKYNTIVFFSPTLDQTPNTLTFHLFLSFRTPFSMLFAKILATLSVAIPLAVADDAAKQAKLEPIRQIFHGIHWDVAYDECTPDQFDTIHKTVVDANTMLSTDIDFNGNQFNRFFVSPTTEVQLDSWHVSICCLRGCIVAIAKMYTDSGKQDSL
jgi:hypothetical protein